MIDKVNITKTKTFKCLMIFLLIGIIILGWLFYKVNWVSASDLPFIENFNNYEIGTLNGQGNWIGNENYKVIANGREGKGVGVNEYSLNYYIQKTGDIITTDGEIYFYFNTDMIDPDKYIQVAFRNSNDDLLWLVSFVSSGIYLYNAYGDYKFADIPSFDIWHYIVCQWQSLSTTGSQARCKLDDGDFGDWQQTYTKESYFSRVKLVNFYPDFKLDWISNTLAPPMLMRIWGISPESGTEITTMDITLTIGYEGFDWDEYKGFSIAFLDERLHASSQTKLYVSDDLDPDGTGEIEVNLQDFDLDRKGKWYLTGLGFGTHLDIEGGMFLTTRGYIDFWSDELVDPEYYLLINVEGLAELYPVSDFDTWYGINVSRYEAPTDEALSIAGFIQPIMEIGGEFSNRAFEIFSVNEAFDKGFSLGEIFPIISGYVGAISYFFGSFPLATWLKYVIILLFGMFLIKAVLKFIPFFGK